MWSVGREFCQPTSVVLKLLCLTSAYVVMRQSLVPERPVKRACDVMGLCVWHTGSHSNSVTCCIVLKVFAVGHQADS